MTFKRLVFVLILVGIAALGFARGTSDSDRFYGGGSYDDGWGRGGWNAAPPETQSYSGTFGIEDDRYPYLDAADGQKYYLMPAYPVSPDSLPVAGDSLEIEAFPSNISPVHLVVVMAAVNGVELTPDNRYGRGYDDTWDGRGYNNGGYGRGYNDGRYGRGYDGPWGYHDGWGDHGYWDGRGYNDGRYGRGGHHGGRHW